MKAYFVLGIAAALSGTELFAQPVTETEQSDRSPLGRLEAYQQCDFPKAERRLLNSLGHEVDGVVVSALREIAKIKLAQPDCASDLITDEVDRLVREGATPAIRFKAYLTRMVLLMPTSFTTEGMTAFLSDEQFFTALARKLESLALSDAAGSDRESTGSATRGGAPLSGQFLRVPPEISAPPPLHVP